MRAPTVVATNTWSLMIVRPEGDADDVDHVFFGGTVPPQLPEVPSQAGQPKLPPFWIRLTSSCDELPNSEAHRRPCESKSRPCTLRWP